MSFVTQVRLSQYPNYGLDIDYQIIESTRQNDGMYGACISADLRSVTGILSHFPFQDLRHSEISVAPDLNQY